MRLVFRLGLGFALASLVGCTALQELAALRSVGFAFDRVAAVRLAGIAITERATYSSLGVGDIARLAAAVASRQVPIELTAHVRAQNPAENKVAARMVQLGWELFLEDRRAMGGTLAEPVSIAPGQTADVPVVVRFDLLQFTGGGARDLFDTALGLAGAGPSRKPMRLELVPTVETSLGPITYPSPIVIRLVSHATSG